MSHDNKELPVMWVKLKGGTEALINKSDFDSELHEEIKGKAVGGPGPAAHVDIDAAAKEAQHKADAEKAAGGGVPKKP